jgi:deoxyribodipyrimidine photo-lyase
LHADRIQPLNTKGTLRGRYVLYWMQQAQRAHWNHALEYAIEEANRLRLPLLACFGITQRFPGANLRHYAFMLDGLLEAGRDLERRGVRVVLRRHPPVRVAAELAGRAAMVVTDRGYLRVQRQWRRRVARLAPCLLVQVETDVVVPVGAASQKEEYSAATLRPKVHALIDRFLEPVEAVHLQRDSLSLRVPGLRADSREALLERLRVSRSAAPVSSFRAGTTAAQHLLDRFIAERLPGYAERRNEPADDWVSHMSPYLHFGHVSPLYVALQVVRASARAAASKQAYLEELVVRRELSMNYCLHNPSYDAYEGLPDWARRTLRHHAADRRPYLYSFSELEKARTHDPYWNAAQQEMVATGKMHNYMRMYWGKKILEWSRSPREAFHTALTLNNRYELDGRDPNSFAGVAWCFGKHDRPWADAPVFGNVRRMSAAGLERKFDMTAYVARVQRAASEAAQAGE